MASTLPETVSNAAPWALHDLPTFPWITTKVLQLYTEEGEEIDVRRLTELLRSDASLSSELLRRANSAMFGLRAEVGSVERAVTMLGLERVKSLALTIGVGSYVRTALKLAILRSCWRHSLACALLAEELAEACEVRPDQGYTAALLHDVGRLALLVKYPESYADLLSVVMENAFDLLASERDLFDIDHCEAGTWLAREWEFPASLVEAIRDHHHPPTEATHPLVSLVHWSCRLADSLGFAVVSRTEQEQPEQVFEHLPKPVRLTPEDVQELKHRVTEKVNSLE